MFYDRFIQLCKDRNVKPTPLIVKLGLSSSNAAQWKKGSTPRPQVLQQIADFFEISPRYFHESDTQSPVVHCFECGLQYNTNADDDVLTHRERHFAWSAAVDKFGFCWETTYRERKKADARAIVNDPDALLADKVDAQIIVYKALFSRSLEASGYSLEHVDFKTYVAMILGQGEGKHFVSNDVYRQMVSVYGAKPGIPQGTYYSVPNKKAPTGSGERSVSDEEIKFALFGGDGEITDAMYDEVRDFAAYVKQREANKKKG